MPLFSTKIFLPFQLKTPKNIKLFVDCVKDLFPDKKISDAHKNYYPHYRARRKEGLCDFYSTDDFIGWLYDQDELELEYMQTILKDYSSLEFLNTLDNSIKIECTEEKRVSNLKRIIMQRLDSCKEQSDCVLLSQEKAPQQKPKKIFISHATDDKAYVKEIVDLLIHMGVKETEQIFCTSTDGTGIPLRAHIYDYIKKQFQCFDIIVLMILSKNYYKSYACLNEMGATWISEAKDIQILLPGFDFSQIDGAVDPRNIAIKLDADDVGARLNELRGMVSEFIGIEISNAPMN